MSNSNEWVVAVFTCGHQDLKRTLVEFYRFVDDLKGVQSLHFLIKDRIEDKVVVSFRIMVNPKLRETVKNKSAQKLNTLLTGDKFEIDPVKDNLAQYVAWSPEKRKSQFGKSKFIQFVDALKNMSAIIIELIENDYFASNERVELAHAMSWMLGCTEYGLLSTKGIEIGYYDRLCDKYCSYLKQTFPRDNNNELRTNS
jgi:hypothetical protein